MSVPSGLTEKPLLQSRKFVAFLVSEITWKIALIILLVTGIRETKIDIFVGSIALAIVIIAGFVEVTFIGKQGDLDKYTRIAQIAANAGQVFQMGDISTKGSPPSEDLDVTTNDDPVP